MGIVDLAAIGYRIQQRRKELGLTQQDVYEEIDVSQNHYSRIENGHVGMSFEILLEISKCLDVSTDYILTGNISNMSNSRFIDKYNKLTYKQRHYIEDHLDLFVEYDND